MAKLTRIVPCLWFDDEGEEAAKFYTGIFENSRILDVTHYGAAGPREEGLVMTVAFELEGQQFIALNGWLTHRFGVSWQIVPLALERLIRDPDRDRSQRAIAAMLGMRKLDVAELERAADAA